MNQLQGISGVGNAGPVDQLTADMFAGGGSMSATDYLGVKQGVVAHAQMSGLELALQNVENDRIKAVINSMT